MNSIAFSPKFSFGAAGFRRISAGFGLSHCWVCPCRGFRGRAVSASIGHVHRDRAQRNSPPAVLLRESDRDDTGRSQKRTLANLSKLSAEVVAGLKALLAGGTVVGKNGLKVERRCRTAMSRRRWARSASWRSTG
jgi:hypothetical protein